MKLGKSESGAFIKIHNKEISFKVHYKKERVLQIIIYNIKIIYSV